MERGVDCLGASIDDEGNPVFLFMCDCGTETAVKIIDLTQTVEFAYTCDSCWSPHWVVIGRIEE